MPDKLSLRCLACGHAFADADVNQCPQCGGTLDVVYDEAIWRSPRAFSGMGVWRFFDLLPVCDPVSRVSLGESTTPLVASAHLGRAWGVPELHFKVEGVMPTGSYKDRIAAVSMARARETGKIGWAATSSGNAGASLSAYGARAGLPGTLFVIEKAARSKIAQIMMYGPRLVAVRGLGISKDAERATFDGVRRLCAQNNWMMMVTASKFNPFGMEGVKTLAYEICEQLGRAPEVVYVPVGGGGLLNMVWKGFREWQRLGRIGSLPRMVSVQGEGCAALADAFNAGREYRPLVESRGTISGLQLADPPDGALALKAVRDSGGWAMAVPDAETARAQKALAAQEGLFVEPAAAITAAAVSLDRASGRLRGDETVMCVLTGVGFKVQDAIQRLTDGVEIPLIEADDILKV
ncbi:MAG: pyridoxal-phosphate dependent enzyme [Chloroflexi bacterium]|nr:pyridoxal-phosphate dependent enzyme [Chloroflexota bacterium]